VRTDLASVFSSLPHHPFPVEARNHEAGGTVPPHSPDVPELSSRKSNISAVTDDVNNQCVRNGLFDSIQVEQMFRRAVCPTIHFLIACDFAHDYPQKIAAVPTLADYFGFDK